METFTDKVKNIVRAIPEGTTMTYQEVALASGNRRAARAVANVMAKNFDKTIPCHRVIRSDGTIGGYNRGGSDVKKQLLVREGAVL